MSFAGIVACQIGNVFACRSDHESVRASSVRSNPLILLGVASEIALLLLLIYVPVLGRPFGLEPLELAHWAFLAPFPGVIIVLEEARKALTRRRNRSGNGYAPVSCRDASRPTGGAASRASECDLQSSKDRARGAPPTGTLASPFSRAVECKAFIRASPCGGPIGDRAAATDEATRRPLQRRRVADRGPPRATAPLP
jgi:hypothetical protein